jgi:hypothetical protein
MGSFIGSITDAVGLTDIEGTRRRGEQSAAQQREAARMGAQGAAFRPVGMTTRFGTSRFGIEDIGGIPRVTSAEYLVSPELQAIQNRVMGLTGGALTTAEQAQMAAEPLGQASRGLFNLAGQYLAESPEAARQRYMNQQYALIDPVRQREEQRLASTVFGRGRAGLNIGDIGQPELYSLAAARRGQDLQLAQQAEQASQQQIGFGTDLFGTGAQLLGNQYAIPTQALGPLQSYLGTIGSVEELGQQPFQLGLNVGGAGQPGATAGAQLLTTGLSNAAATQRAAGDAASGQLTGFMNQMLSAALGAAGMPGGGGGGLSAMGFGGGTYGAASGYGLGSLGYGAGYGINPMGQQARMLASQWS